jgi:zinc protease
MLEDVCAANTKGILTNPSKSRRNCSADRQLGRQGVPAIVWALGVHRAIALSRCAQRQFLALFGFASNTLRQVFGWMLEKAACIQQAFSKSLLLLLNACWRAFGLSHTDQRIMMRAVVLFFSLLFLVFAGTAQAQSVIPISEKGGLYEAYVVPRDDFDRVDVQLIVLSGAYDDPEPSGTAHLTEHLAAFSADATILRKPRERDIYASTYNVSTIYTNSGAPSEIEMLLKLSRAVLDTPSLPEKFAESEIDIVQRETLLRERQSSFRWLRRIALQNLYGTLRGRADNTVEDLPKLSLEKAYQFHKEHYVPSNVMLIVSGNVEPHKAEQLVARIFGDTEPSEAPQKPWLDHKPDPALRSVERLKSDRIERDTVQLAKFVDFEDRSTSIDMQGAFFIVTGVLNERFSKTLYHENTGVFSYDIDWYFAKNADLELTIELQLMPGFSLDAAQDLLNETLANLLKEPISRKEIHDVRQKEVVWAQNSARRPTAFLWFLKNVASDGFPPVTPTVFADTLNNTTDQEVIDFAQNIVKPSATSFVLAEKEN